MSGCSKMVVGVTCVMWSANIARAAPPQSDKPPAKESQESDRAFEREVHDLVDRLGSSSFAERRLATNELFARCPRAFDPLMRAYHETDDFETRIRIQDLVERAFFEARLLQRSGFLGVSLQPLSSNMDKRLEPGHGAVEVQKVVEDTAAGRAGVEDGDVIFEINGRPFPDDVRTDEFSNMIRMAGPGTHMRLTVFRRDNLLPLSIEVILGARPLEHYGDPENLQRLEETAQEFKLWWAENFEADQDDHDKRSDPPDEE